MNSYVNINSPSLHYLAEILFKRKNLTVIVFTAIFITPFSQLSRYIKSIFFNQSTSVDRSKKNGVVFLKRILDFWAIIIYISIGSFFEAMQNKFVKKAFCTMYRAAEALDGLILEIRRISSTPQLTLAIASLRTNAAKLNPDFRVIKPKHLFWCEVI
jgi:hypothetical protein